MMGVGASAQLAAGRGREARASVEQDLASAIRHEAKSHHNVAESHLAVRRRSATITARARTRKEQQ